MSWLPGEQDDWLDEPKFKTNASDTMDSGPSKTLTAVDVSTGADKSQEPLHMLPEAPPCLIRT